MLEKLESDLLDFSYSDLKQRTRSLDKLIIRA